jgi:manganese/zinc/iron transport system permease protein
MMSAAGGWLWQLDGWIITAGVLCAAAASLLGNFLVLRRSSMLGDAISHAVLPGLAVAFIITGSRQNLPMFVGAAVVGVLTAVLTHWIRDLGKVDEGASMGVVFTTLFALGLVLIVKAADHVDLDPGCVLYGAIELIPLDTARWAGWDVPRVVIILLVTTIINLLFVIVFFKELRLTSFDPEMATSLGFGAHRIHYALMTLVAVTAVASFESVGNILVVAMFVVPPATARLLTDRLATMVALSVLIGAVAAILGHWSAITIPRWFGYASTTTAGMMAVMTGVAFVLAVIFSPSQGLVFRAVRTYRLTWGILSDDLLAYLYRLDERSPGATASLAEIRRTLFARPSYLRLVLLKERISGRIESSQNGYYLTPRGHETAAELVRAHRLWEQYLVDRAGVATHRIHGQAEKLEHFTGRSVRDELERQTRYPTADPHGSPIPTERGGSA